MAESQSIEHKQAYWRRVVLKWVKCADLNTSHDSVDLDTCYINFRCKIKPYYDLHESTAAEFLRVQFPDFELLLNKENEIPKCDAVYVFSLMLYFSCIRHPIPYFQNVGKEFDVAYQQSMTAFLNSFVSKDGNQIVINRPFLDKAFQNAKPFATVLSEESCNRRDLSQQMITSTPSGKLDMKKPSPTTPKSVALEWKLKNLNALLETAQTENINQDRQIERLLQNVKELQEEKRMYQSKINILQLKETCACGNNLTNLSNATNRITEQLQKQLESKHNNIEMLQEELSKLNESVITERERYMSMKKQYEMVQEDNQRMKLAVQDLKEEISTKESCNQNLFEIVKDLRRFISENHIKDAEMMEPLESSFEFLDQSFKNMASDDSQCYDLENLASTVVDIKLKEKEQELVAMSTKMQELEDNLKAMIEDLNCQLESQKKIHLEEQDYLQAELNGKCAKLREALTAAEKEKSLLVEDIEKSKATIEDLNRQLKEHESLQTEMSQKTEELLQALDEARRDKSELTKDIEEGKSLVKDLYSQLESQKKMNLDELVRIRDEMIQKTTELRQTLAKTEKEKSHIVEDFEKAKVKIEDLNSQLKENKRIQAELNETNAQLRQTLAEADNEKSQLAEDFQKDKAELNNQIQIQKKVHLQEHERLQVEMKQKTSEMLQALANAEKEKSHIVEDLEQGKAKIEELNSQLEDRERLQAELNEKNAQLAEAVIVKLQLAEDIEKDKAEMKELNNQLEFQKKMHLEERTRLQAEMSLKSAQFQRCVDEAEIKQSQLVEELEKGKALIKDLNSQVESIRTEMNTKIAEFKRCLDEAEKDTSQLAREREEGKALVKDLSNQLESQKKIQEEEHERLQAEMNQKIAELRQALAEIEKSKETMEDLKRQLQEHEHLQAEVNENTAQLRQALVNAEQGKSQLTEELEKDKAKIKVLSIELETQKKINLEEHERLQAEMNQKIAELRQALAEATNEKSQLAEDIEKNKVAMEDLNRQLQEHERLQAEVSENTAQLRQALANAEQGKSQLTEELEKDKAKIKVLSIELETLQKIHLEEHERLQAEMNQKIAELRQALADIEKNKVAMEDLNRQLQEHEHLQAEVNENTAQLRQALVNAEQGKSQLTEELEKDKAKIKVLSIELETQKKIHLEEHERLQAEMNQQTAELRQALAEATNEKSQLAQDIEKNKVAMEDLNRQLQEHERRQAELNENTAQLRQALANAEQGKSQLTEELEKDKAKIKVLSIELETLQKLHLEEHERLQAEMNQQTAELRQALAEATNEKSQLAQDIEKNKVAMEDLNRQLQEHERRQAELNENTAQLRQALANAEQGKAQLTEELEKDKAKIKVLSIELETQKKIHLEENERLQAEMNQKTEVLRKSLVEAEREISQVAEDLQKDKSMIKELNNQLEDHKRLQAEYNGSTAGLRQALAEAEKEKAQLADDLDKEKSKSEDLNRQLEQVEKTKLLDEQSNICVRDDMVRKLSALQENLDEEKEKSEEINCQYLQAKQQADDLGVQCTKLMQQLSADRTDIANLQQQLAAKDAKLNELSVRYEEKSEQYEKSYQASEILSAKLYKTRQTFKEKEELWAQDRASMVKAMEEKIRDARIENDSKMAKMKDRMVELHKEGKTKLECDNHGLLLTVDGYRRKVENLEIRCAKLQQQLAEMNERNLEVRKENQLLLIRIKSLDEFSNERKSVLLPTQANLRNNFKMEDEEGELFNNMYLADLKSGRCVSPGPSSTKGGVNRYSELSQRNSMLLPHLRTNYVALEPDCEPLQDDTRENMSTTFDDSSTGLISRRKVSGITSYKRPGPPTPSKRAGRLSLTGALSGNVGGGEIQYKEVLRDTNANVAVAGAAAGTVGSAAESAARTGRTKTPGKFKQMISSSSLLNNFQRDEDNTFALLKVTAARLQRCAMDSIPLVIPSSMPIRSNAYAKQKRLQRKLAFDANRCLGENIALPLPFTVDEQTAVPLGTILEWPLAKEEQDQIIANTLDGTIPVAPATTLQTTPDYSFKHPYGCSRYNIQRKQELRREKRRQLYDDTRKLPFKGKSGASIAVAIESPKMDASIANHSIDSNVTTDDHTDDISLFYSFTSIDMKDSAVPTDCPLALATSGRCSSTGLIPLFLLFAAWFGMLALLMFCFGELDPNATPRPNAH